MFKQGDSPYNEKYNVRFFQKFYGKIWIGFWHRVTQKYASGYRFLKMTNGNDIVSSAKSILCKHVTEGFLKNRKTYYSGSSEAPPWFVRHWIRFWIFSSLERWKQNFRDEFTKNFYCEEGVIRNSITSN